MERIVEIVFAFVIDIFAGDPPFPFHPVRLMGRFILWEEPYCRKITRNQKFNGFLLVVSLLAIVYTFTCFLSSLPFFLRCSVCILLIYSCISIKDLGYEGLRVYDALIGKDIERARYFLSRIVSRETESLDEEEIIRATVETIAENSVDGIISPLFYAFLGGVPLALLFKAVSTLDSMIGYKDEVYRDFGCFAAKLDDIANFIPARLTFVFLPLVGAILGISPIRVFKVMLRDRKKGTSPNAPIPEAGFAAIMGITLGGTNYYRGKRVDKPILGDGLRKKRIEDICFSVRIMYLLSVVSLIVMVGVYFMLLGL